MNGRPACAHAFATTLQNTPSVVSAEWCAGLPGCHFPDLVFVIGRRCVIAHVRLLAVVFLPFLVSLARTLRVVQRSIVRARSAILFSLVKRVAEAQAAADSGPLPAAANKIIGDKAASVAHPGGEAVDDPLVASDKLPARKLESKAAISEGPLKILSSGKAKSKGVAPGVWIVQCQGVKFVTMKALVRCLCRAIALFMHHVANICYAIPFASVTARTCTCSYVYSDRFDLNSYRLKVGAGRVYGHLHWLCLSARLLVSHLLACLMLAGVALAGRATADAVVGRPGPHALSLDLSHPRAPGRCTSALGAWASPRCGAAPLRTPPTWASWFVTISDWGLRVLTAGCCQPNQRCLFARSFEMVPVAMWHLCC